VGRVLQDKTYQELSFERDYKAYFPIAVMRIIDGNTQSVTLPEIQLNDTLLIHNQELIPVDGILTMGKALIDYSFVTGESIPVEKQMGEIIYAGGKQISGNIEMLVIKEVAQSYLTKLWNRTELHAKTEIAERSFVHLLSRYFTAILFTIAILAALYWYVIDSTRIWQVVTAVLIVACPCALLLSNTFTNGNILRRLGRNQFYLRNAQTIEEIAKVNYIVFDKTGTLTTGRYQDIVYEGVPIEPTIIKKIAALATQSTHPMSRAIVAWSGEIHTNYTGINSFQAFPGKGIQGIVDGDTIVLGAAIFVTKNIAVATLQSAVYVSVNNQVLGKFEFKNHYRENIPALLQQLIKLGYPICVLSGDAAGEQENLEKMLGFESPIYFNQKPADKLEVIKKIQLSGKKVMMVGDGLNDAGALKQADVGIAISENSSHFTPASDVIMEAAVLPKLYQYIRLCKANKRLVMTAFIVSILYNIVGISFAVQGNLSPMVAAILMPTSSLSILLVSFGASNFLSWKMGFK
jgi:Cu+-exporting ATPase